MRYTPEAGRGVAPPALVLVFGGTLMVSMAGGTIADFKLSLGALKTAFTGGVKPAAEIIPAIVSLADKARRGFDAEFAVSGEGKPVEGATVQLFGLHALLKGVGPSQIYVRLAFDQLVVSGNCLAYQGHGFACQYRMQLPIVKRGKSRRSQLSL